MAGRETSGNRTGDRPAEATLFEAANRLRGSVESAEYKHLVLGLVFLKYVSDEFDRRRAELKELARTEGSDYFSKDGVRCSEHRADRPPARYRLVDDRRGYDR